MEIWYIGYYLNTVKKYIKNQLYDVAVIEQISLTHLWADRVSRQKNSYF